jgi:hypothetical protein
MVAPLIPILLQLASFAPSLMKFVGAGDKATKITEEVVNVVQTVTGAKAPEEAVEILRANPDKVLEFRRMVQENEMRWDEMYLKDVQSARDRDVKLAQAGYRNYRAHLMFGIAVGVIVFLLYMVWADQAINEYVKGIVTLVLGRFLGYLDAIYNFEFGTTRSSKAKDETIGNLTSKLGG